MSIALDAERDGLGMESSNVGGWHSERDVLEWDHVRKTSLASILEDAVTLVERSETLRLGSPQVFCT